MIPPKSISERELDETVLTEESTSTISNKTISGADNIISGITEDMQSLSDVTTLDVTTSKHGYVPKAPNLSTKFLRGDATWAIPSYTTGARGARVYNSSAIAISNATGTKLTFDSEIYDTDGIHSTSSNTGRLTCVTDGIYSIGGNIQWQGNNTGRRLFSIVLNNTTSIADVRVLSGAAGNDPAQNISTQYSLVAGDYVELSVYQDSGGSLNILASTHISPEFYMVRIGA